MTDPITSYRRIDTGRGIVYRLPGRPLGKLRWLAVLPFLFAFLVFSFAATWIGGLVNSAFSMGSGGSGSGVVQWIPLVFALFGLLPAMAGLVPTMIGLSMLAGRNEIIVRNGRLYAVDCVGFLRWTRKRKLETVDKLNVASPPAAGEFTRDLAGIVAISEDRKRPFIVAWGYPHGMLKPLADELAAECEGKRAVDSIDEPAEPIVVEEVTMDLAGEVVDESDSDEIPEQPSESRCILEERKDGLTLTVPPAGLFKGSKGLFFFSILWNGFLVIFTGMGIAQREWTMVLFSLIFWAVGIGLVLASINMGRRQTIIDVVDGALLISRRSLFGTKQHEWTREELASVHVGPSGMEVNEEPVMNLRIRPREGKEVGILTELDDEELHWVAANLRAALAVGRDSSGGGQVGTGLNPTDIPAQPAASRTIVERYREGPTFTVPPAGIWKGSKGLFFFSIIWLGMSMGIAGTMTVASLRGGSVFDALVPAAFLLVFSGIGVAMLLGSINMGRRKAILDVARTEFIVSRQSIFGIKQHQWSREDLKSILVAPSGTVVNGRPIMCLKIEPRGGTALKMLSQLDDNELEWLAAELREALGLSVGEAA